MQQLFLLVGGVAHDIGKILPLETHLEDVLLAESESLLYVVHHLRRSRCGKSKHGSVGFQLPYIDNFEVRRPEVIAPLADAMGFIYCDEAHLHVFQFCLEEF